MRLNNFGPCYILPSTEIMANYFWPSFTAIQRFFFFIRNKAKLHCYGPVRTILYMEAKYIASFNSVSTIAHIKSYFCASQDNSAMARKCR